MQLARSFHKVKILDQGTVRAHGLRPHARASLRQVLRLDLRNQSLKGFAEQPLAEGASQFLPRRSRILRQESPQSRKSQRIEKIAYIQIALRITPPSPSSNAICKRAAARRRPRRHLPVCGPVRSPARSRRRRRQEPPSLTRCRGPMGQRLDRTRPGMHQASPPANTAPPPVRTGRATRPTAFTSSAARRWRHFPANPMR